MSLLDPVDEEKLVRLGKEALRVLINETADSRRVELSIREGKLMIEFPKKEPR